MATIPVVVKHQGKKYNVDLDPSANGETFKFQLFSLTGVEPDRQKVLVKGGQLKDDTELGKLGAKPGHVFMMMGTPSGTAGIEKPKEQVKFLEDMTEAEKAQADGAIPAGLQNLGNTCYMNSTIQVLRSIPELQEELKSYRRDPSQSSGWETALSTLRPSNADITGRLRELFQQLSSTQDSFPPHTFWITLREVFPQFAQKSREGMGYAQQDAEEAWSQIVSKLREALKIKETTASGTDKLVPWVDKYMSGTFDTSLECDEPEAKERDEEPVNASERFFKLNCHINAETNHLRDGLMNGLKEQLEKNSEALGRDAVYTKTSRIARLPKYLPVHFMRFDGRKTTNKKAKIMRKVTFPIELDIVEFCNDDLKKALIPIRDKIRDIRKEEEDIDRARKRQKRMRENEAIVEAEAAKKGEKKDEKKPEKKDDKKGKKSGEDTEMEDVGHKTDAEIEAERTASILASKKELFALMDQKEAEDPSVNHTGLYELRGIITHQGISADSGHYTAFVKKTGRKDPVTGKVAETDNKWWWFNDDKVTEFDEERLPTLAGGGQNHAALILLYRAIPLPALEEEPAQKS